MINEYLFLSDEYRVVVEEYTLSDVIVEISSIENTQLWVATFSVEGKNEDGAKKLSDVHNTLAEYSPLVLSCESSEYYNRMLFPLINELERKLRKLLYLAVSISDNTEAKKSIQRLEEKDFGEIFDLLFIDMNFISNLKKRINADAKSEFNGKSKYSKQEIQAYLDKLEENLLWDVILKKDDVPTLRRRFRDVQTYRNDVMHAHNIVSGTYAKAKYLFEKINRELSITIGRLIGQTEENLHSQDHEVNKAIDFALTTMELASAVDILNALTNTPVKSGTSAFLAQVAREIQDLYPQSSSAALTSAVQSTIPVLSSSINMDAIREIQDSMAFFTSPEMAELQKHAKMAAEELSIYYDSIKPYQTWLDAQRQITPPPSDNPSSSTHETKVEDTDSQGETPAETEENK
mgnify:CR=1 FL=1